MKKILVTGASGFVGRHLCKLLVEQGYQVLGTFRFHSPKKSLAACRMVPLDITEPESVKRLLQAWKPDNIAHLAAQSLPRLSWRNEVKTMAANTAGTIHLLNAVRLFCPKARFLYVSTNQVYNSRVRPGLAINESTPIRPENPYAYSKALGEMACMNFYSSFGLPVIIARPFNHVGRGESVHLAFSNWCRQIARIEQSFQKSVLFVGNLNVERDFLHVDDVTRAYVLILKKGKFGEIYNIASGKPHLLSDYVKHLRHVAKVPFTVHSETTRFQRQEVRKIKGDSVKLRSLGWKPESSPFFALEELLNEWREKIQAKKEDQSWR